MNNKPYAKLRLGKTSRTQNSGISRFFSQNASESELSHSIDQDKPPVKKLKESEKSITSDFSREPNDSHKKCSSGTFQGQFLPPPKSKLKPTDIKHENKTSITNFFNQSESDNDFDTPKKEKNRPKVKSYNKVAKKKPKRQMKIKSAFLKNEEIFSEIINQHSIADNINSEELQLALALSRSEIEINKSFNEKTDDYEKDVSNTSNNIRTKLQEFGFKTSTNDKDYELSLYLPTKKKTKWANKFTPLTLRDPEKQIKKLEGNVENILSREFPNKKEIASQTKFTLISSFLKNFESKTDFFQTLHYSKDILISKYYVLDIFTPTTVKVGYLLKDYRKIPGRDCSPILKTKIQRCVNEQMTNEEITDTNSLKIECENVEVYNHLRNDIETAFQSNINAISPSTSKICPLLSQNNVYSPVDTLYTSQEQYINAEKIIQHNYLCSKGVTDTSGRVQYEMAHNEKVMFSRESSPDIFAEFEPSITEDKLNIETIDMVDIQEGSRIQHKGNLNDGIKDNGVVTFEKFSSDEVKICGAECNESNALENAKTFKNSITLINEKDFVDLTADSDSNPEHSISKNESNKCSNSVTNTDCAISQYSSQRVSQESSSDHSCIILSDDDEVNYSIKVANKKFEDVVNITFSSSESIDSEDNNPTKTTYNTRKKNHKEYDMHNFSFIQLLGEKEFSSSISNEDSQEIDSPRKSQCGESPKSKNNIQAKRSLSFSKSLLCFNKEDINDILRDRVKENKILQSIAYSDLNLSANVQVMGLLTPSISYKLDLEESERNSFSVSDIIKANISEKKRNNSLDLDEVKQLIQEYHTEEAVADESSPVLNKFESKSSYNKTLSDSFINQEKFTTSITKTYSNCTKFSKFVEEDPDFSDVDEIDKLVYGSPAKRLSAKKPEGIDKLITAELSFTQNTSQRKYEHDNKVYLVKTDNISPKPDYERMDSPTRLKELYKYGLKPLKKKQAVTILDYIYNQTHPFIIEDNNDPSSSEEDHISIVENPHFPAECEISVKPSEGSTNQRYDNFKLKDCFFENFSNSDEVGPEVTYEELIFQTNARSKIPTVLLPFHIAWFNLIKSNNDLREAVLHYEPIDLQEIFLFFKMLGYRYEPKDIKRYFDRKCILFRYDLSDGNSNRHTRKRKHVNFF